MHNPNPKKGKEHPNYKHGAFSKYLRSDLTDDELEAIDDMVGAFDDPQEAMHLIREQAAEAWLKYKRSGDHRFLREYRQLADTFNLAPNEDVQEIEHTGDVDVGVDKEALGEMLNAEPDT